MVGKVRLLLVIMKTVTREKIEAELKECLHFLAGDNCPADWRADDDVLLCCDIDSMHGLELACDLAARLGIGIPLRENPLIEDDKDSGRKRHRTFSEVVNYLEKLAAT